REHDSPDDPVSRRTARPLHPELAANLLAERVERHGTERHLVGRLRRAPGDNGRLDRAAELGDAPTDGWTTVDLDVQEAQLGERGDTRHVLDLRVGAPAGVLVGNVVVGGAEVPCPPVQTW